MARPTRSLGLLAAALALASLLPAQQQDLHLGTWNLEFFGSRKDPAPRTADDVAKTAGLIRELGVSLLAVQEIGGEQPLTELCRAIGPNWRFVLGTSGGWTDGSSRQSIGFLWDDAVLELLHAEELNGLPRRHENLPIFHRVPVTAAFRDRRTQFDFRAVTVHFKAGQKKDDERKREFESGFLRQWLDTALSRTGEDQDVVVLGDFNATYGSMAETQLSRDGAFRLLRKEPREATILHFEDPIDHLAVSRGFDEADESTFDSHAERASADREAFRRTHSDHFPVTVTVRSAKDADPESSFLTGAPAQPLAVGPGAPAPRPASDAAATEADPMGAGSRVVIALQGGNTVEGTLLRSLQGNWAYVRDREGSVLAVPATTILHVKKL